MKKIIVCALLLLVLILTSMTAGADIFTLEDAKESFGLDTRALDGTLAEVRTIFGGDFSAERVIASIMGGGDALNEGIAQRIGNLFLGELRLAIKGSLIILAIIIICAVINVMQSSFSKSEVSSIADAICVIASAFVVTVILKQLISTGISSVESGVSFIKTLAPSMVLLLVTGGAPASAGAFEFWLFVLLEAMAGIISYIFVPLIYCYLGLCAVDAVFENVTLSKLADLFKSFLSFALGLMLTVFTGFIGINSMARGLGDVAASKTVKFAISSAVPVIGKIISDAADMVMSFSNVLKSAFGIFGIIATILIFAVPILKVGAQMVIFRVLAALSASLSNSRVTKLLSSFATAITFVFSINVCVCVFIIASLGLLIMAGVK